MDKILIFYTKITPRLVRRIECLAAHCPGLVAVELAGSEKPYPWWTDDYALNLRKETLFPGVPLEEIPTTDLLTRCRALLEAEQPRVTIVSSYTEPAMRFAAQWTRQHGGRSVLLSISWMGDRRRYFWKEWAKRMLIQRCYDGICVAGQFQYEYARHLGFTNLNIWKQFNVIDNAFFAEQARATLEHRDEHRARLGLPERYFLYVGALEPWKNGHRLLSAYHAYRAQGGAWDLVLVGTGSLEAALRERVYAEGIPGVHLPGMQQTTVLPQYYALASCFVLPSLSEPWGLVINEAEACGLPVLASTKCGCYPELVHAGINGYVFDPTDEAALATLMARISSDRTDLASFGLASREIVQGLTPERWAQSLAACVKSYL